MKERVFKIMSNVFKVPLEEVNEDSSPDNIASWESIKHMELVLALEEEFAIEFAPEQIGEILNGALVIEIVKECTG